MKIFSWMKSKLHGKDNTIKPEPESTSYDMMHQDCKEEISGCPNALLAIGTFGNNLKDPKDSKHEEEDDEEVDKELRELLNRHISHDSSFLGELENHDSIEELLDSFPEDEEITDEFIRDAILQRATSAVHARGKNQIPSDKRKTGLYRKSLSFLLKRALMCGGGFVPRPIISPILKHPFPDPKSDNSTMDKILRAMLRKKKYRQRQKYLDMPKTDNETQGDASNAHNWVKTDSEYIVLEL